MELDPVEVSPKAAADLLAPDVPSIDDAEGTGPEVADASPHRARPRRTRWLGCALVVAAALLVGTTVIGSVSHHHLQQTDSALAAQRAELRRTESQLAVAQSELTTVQGQSDATGRILSSESTQLATDQARLARAQADLFDQGISISELDTCISGVEKSLNQIALGVQAGAVATLESVAGNCQSAEPSGT
jgi:ABC-type transport system involved in cytochrome bd biosynthesis fused ATPase/permease subunit